MDLSLRKTSSTWVRIFQKGEFWELQKEILREKFRPLWTEIGFFFRAEVSKYKASRWSIFSCLSLNKIWPRVFHSIITVIHFFRAIKLYKYFYEIVLRNYELCKFWSVDYSACFDFRCFPSHSTTPRIKLSCKSVNWPAIRGYFGPCSHVTETQGFVQQKKTERQAKTFKKVKLHSNKTVSSR